MFTPEELKTIGREMARELHRLQQQQLDDDYRSTLPLAERIEALKAEFRRDRRQ